MTQYNRTLPWPLVETTWLAEHLIDPDLRILDCSIVVERKDGVPSFVSGREAWNKAHIPGCQYVDVLQELSDSNQSVPMMALPVEQFALKMSELGVGENTKVVLYDRSEHAWAARVWWMLRAAGFENAGVLNGGWTKWTREGREQSSDASTYTKANFVPQPNPSLFADKNEVLAAIDDSSTAVINALPPDIFAGRVSPYARPGRIPGSSNVFCQSLVNPDTNTYLPVDELQQCFAHTKADLAERTITYCGGGIAASGDALALTLMGVENVAVYDGSLSEWAADPSLPLETD